MGPPAGLISWDATTGELLSHIRFQIPMYSKPIWMLDGTRGRILAKESMGDRYRLVDLKSGQAVAELPDDPDADPKHPAFAVGLVGDGNEVLLFKPGWLEVWQLDPMKLVRRRPSPWAVDHYIPGCVGGIPATYNDQRCWEWSPDRGRRHAGVFSHVAHAIPADRRHDAGRAGTAAAAGRFGWRTRLVRLLARQPLARDRFASQDAVV
jgi:hypothetical protein